VAPLVYETDHNKLSTSLAVRVRANPPPFIANQELGTTVGSWNDVSNVQAKRLRDILVQVEDKVFDSKPRFFSVFKSMDVDNDGYISYKDFEAHLLKNKIEATQSEIVTLMHTVLDPEKKGYIAFSDFQKRFRPRMSD
jgi:Ca2+-binding EF-hand superfamily protein